MFRWRAFSLKTKENSFIKKQTKKKKKKQEKKTVKKKRIAKKKQKKQNQKQEEISGTNLSEVLTVVFPSWYKTRQS